MPDRPADYAGLGQVAEQSQNAVELHQPLQTVEPLEIRQPGADTLQHLVVVEEQAAGAFVQQTRDRCELGHRRKFGVAEMEMGHVRTDERDVSRKEFADAVSDETLADPLRNGDQLVFGVIMPVGRKMFEYKILLRKRRSGCRNDGFVKHDLILLSEGCPSVQI